MFTVEALKGLKCHLSAPCKRIPHPTCCNVGPPRRRSLCQQLHAGKPAVRRFSRTARQLSVPLAADVRGLGTLCGSRSVTDATCGSGAVLRMSVFPVFGLLKGFQRRILHAASRPVAGGGALVKNFTQGPQQLHHLPQLSCAN